MRFMGGNYKKLYGFYEDAGINFSFVCGFIRLYVQMQVQMQVQVQVQLFCACP